MMRPRRCSEFGWCGGLYQVLVTKLARVSLAEACSDGSVQVLGVKDLWFLRWFKNYENLIEKQVLRFVSQHNA